MHAAHQFGTPVGGAAKQKLDRNTEREKDKATVAPGPPSFTSFPNSAPLRGSLRRWRKLLAAGAMVLDLALDLGKGVAQLWEFLPQSPALTLLSDLSLGFLGRPRGGSRSWEGLRECLPPARPPHGLLGHQGRSHLLEWVQGGGQGVGVQSRGWRGLTTVTALVPY